MSNHEKLMNRAYEYVYAGYTIIKQGETGVVLEGPPLPFPWGSLVFWFFFCIPVLFFLWLGKWGAFSIDRQEVLLEIDGDRIKETGYTMARAEGARTGRVAMNILACILVSLILFLWIKNGFSGHR
jgi:hypothetical protein